MGFIEEFTDFLLDREPTQKEWAESIATAVFSATVCKDRYHLNRQGQILLNPWFLYIGPSGLAHKSQTMKHIYPLLNRVSELSKVKHNLLIPSRFSLEGLIDYFHKQQNYGLLIKDEFTSAIKDTSKDYLNNLMEFYSEIWDGKISGRVTRKINQPNTIDVFVSCLAATTPYIYRIMKPDVFIQGTGNRFLYLIYHPFESKITPEELLSSTIGFNKETEHHLEEFAQNLAKASTSSIRVVNLFGSNLEDTASYYTKNNNQVLSRYMQDEYDLMATYMARATEHTLKLASIKTLSDRYKEMANTHLDTIPVSTTALDWALEKVNFHLEQFKILLEKWNTNPSPLDIPTLDKQVSFAYDAISSQINGITWGELRSKIKWKVDIWREVIQLLFDTKRIAAFQLRPGQQGGRPQTRIYSKIRALPAKNTIQGTYIDSWDTFKLVLRL